VRSWKSLVTPDGDAVFSTFEAVSGSDGSFHIQGGNGDVLRIDGLEKDGFEPEPKSLKGFGYTASDPLRPDPKNPVVLRMWKSDRRVQLISDSKRYSLLPDGRTYTIDLRTGTIKESTTAEGDLRVSIWRHANAAWGQNYDWILDLQPVDGGLAEETDDLAAMFLAPETGYAKSYRVEAKAADHQWSYGTGKKRFYLKSRGGQNFARIEIEAYAYYLQNKQGRFNVTYTVNPAGERLLR
jgi:hypothetical protein